MARTQSHTPTVFAILALGFCILASLFVATASAYLFGPGKYSGVVVFDRWGTCYLVSGPYVNYVASDVKSGLLPYKGRAMQVDASEVTQGGLLFEDPMIHKYKILGPAPVPKWVTLDGLQLLAVQAFGRYTRPQFLIELRNNGKSPVRVDRSEIGILLFKAEKPELSSADDDSVALISRNGIEEGSYISSAGVGNQKSSWGYIVDMKTQPPPSFVIAPGQSVRTLIRFKVYPGQYQFMFAYGGGVSAEKSLASNAISFDMSADGRAILTPSHDGQASGPGQKIIDLPQGAGHFRPKLSLQNALKIAKGYNVKEHIDSSSYWLYEAKFILYGAESTADKDKTPGWYFWWVNDGGALGDYIEIFVSMDGKAMRLPSM